MKFTQKQIIYIILGIIILLSLNPKIFWPILIIGIIIAVFFNNQIKTLINKFKNMNQQTVDINKATTKGLKFFKSSFIIIIILFLGIILAANMIVIINAGETGVYHLFGKVKDEELPSGIHLINPFANVTEMSTRTEQYTMSIAQGEGERIGDDSIDSLTKEGLKITLDLSVLYHLQEDQASEVFKNIGTDYAEKIIRPEVRNSIRKIIALYEAKDIYSEKRQEAADKILEDLKNNIEPRGIEIETVLLRNVVLPPLLTQAIEDKLTAEQEAQKYDFVLQREEKEAERKRIEAEGQKDAQQIINQSLSNQYLQYLYIRELKDRQGTIYVPYDMPLFRGL